MSNLDNNNSAYLEFDYIVDPTGWTSPTGATDPSSQWTNEARAYDENTATYASHTAAVGWQGYLELTLGSAIYCNRVRVFSDFDSYYVDKVSIDVYNTSSWIEKYNGTISNCAWTEVEFGAESNVTKARFRYHYIRGSVIFWFYEFDFWQGQPLTLPNGTTLAVTSIDETTAILKGNITNDGGEPCEYRFQYGANTSYGTNTTWGGSEATGSEFNTMIHGLTLGNTYQYRVQIRNDLGTINGSNKNFTTAAPALGWVTPTSHYDPNAHWTNEDRAYDDDLDTYTDSYHAINDPDGVWSFFIYLNHSALICDKVRFYARGPTGDPTQVDQVDVDVCRGGVWVNVYEGTFTDKTWVEKGFTQGSVNQSRIRFRMNAANGGLYYQLYGFDFNNSRPVPMIMDEGPTNKSWGVSLLPQLNITVMNPDGAAMTITWSSNSSGSWQVFGTNSSVTNGTYHQLNTNFSSNNTKYWWKVSVTDGTDTNTSLYYFSTPDTINPSSNVVAVTPYWKKTSPLTITSTASDTGWSGLKNVTLYYRYRATNASGWGGYVSFGVDTASPWSWSFTFGNGTGHYAFYSIAKDNATNGETAPATNDTNCGYDNVAPSSSVNAIATYWQKTSPLAIDGIASDTGGSGLCNVTLRYRYSSDNNSWGGWVNSGFVDSNPWVAISWSFPFFNDTGYYEFYSIAKDNATNTESAPGAPDTICRYTNITIPIVITNASTGVEKTNATLQGYLQSSGGENCTVRFEYGTTTSYGINTTNQTKTTDQTFSANIQSLTKGQLYHYRSFANNTLQSDSGNDLTLLTRPDPPNTLNAQPNSSVIYLTWNTGTGANTTYIERNTSGQTIWTRGQGELVYNGSATNYEDSDCNPGTTYYYQAWSFTTWASNPALSQYSNENDTSSAVIAVNISIGVTPLAWDQGTILIGDSNATSGLYFNLTNQGNVPMNIQIKASNATNATTGAKWNLTGSSGLDNFSLQYKKSGGVSWTPINLTYNTFVLNLPATGTDWLTFDLNLIMATTSSTGDPLSLTITFKSVIA
jgi:hypothetical protein